MTFPEVPESLFSEQDVKNGLSHVLATGFKWASGAKPAKLLILGGQPGAGKTAVLQKIAPDIPFVNADEYRILHPKHSQLVRDVATFPKYTQPFVNTVANALVDYCFRNQFSFAVEGTMRNPEVPIATMKQCRASSGDYEIELHVVTVPARVSWQSCNERFESMVASSGQGRAVNKEIHDNAVKILAENVASIVETGLADRVYIRDRKQAHFIAKSVNDADEAAATIRSIQNG